MDWNIEVKDIISNVGNYYTLHKDKVTIGREESNDIVIDNKYISSHHLTLKATQTSISVKDENSSNGTTLNKDNKWIVLKGSQKVNIPIQIKLAGAVLVNIQSNVSQVYNLKELEQQEAIMVVDICDSTRLSSLSDEIAFHIKRRLSTIAKPILYNNHINFFKSTGDGFLTTFPTSENALDAAKKILQALEKRNNNTTNPPINIRIGLHLGKTYVIDPVTKDIHGNDTNITFRLEGIKPRDFIKVEQDFPKTNRILCSHDFQDDIIKIAPQKASHIHYCGKAKLKGIKDAVDVYNIPWE